MSYDFDQRDKIIKILDPDYFLCDICREWVHVSIRCKQKMLKQCGQPDRFLPSTHPLCIPCNNGQEWWEWKIEMSNDIVNLTHPDISQELVNVIGEQIEAK